MKSCFFCFLSTFGVLGLSGQDASSSVSGYNCTFQAAHDNFLAAEARARLAVHQRAQQFQKSAAVAGKSAAAATPIARRNLIDDEIFDKLANMKVQPARLTTDEEFFRRINLDLTGRIQAPTDIPACVDTTNPGKREGVIEKVM